MKLTTLVVISTEYHTIMAMTYPIHICLSTTILWYFVSIFFVIVDKYILLHEILLIVCKNGFLRFNITKVKSEIWDEMRSLFREKYVNDSMVIKNLSKLFKYNVTKIHIRNQRYNFISCLLLDNIHSDKR